MTSIGLDIGTGFVKCVSDSRRIKFPSLCAYRQHAVWENRKGRIEAVGDEAVRLARYPDSVVIRPVMQGRPIHERGFEELVKKAVDLVLQNSDAMGKEAELARSCMAIGLPYEARPHATGIQKMVTRLFHPKRCDIVPQVLGTLIDVDLPSAIIVSIGQGTTEIVAFEEYSAIRGTSVHHAVNDISSKIGTVKTAYLDDAIFKDPKVNSLVAMLADSILDDLNGMRQDLEDLPLVVSGGGIMIPKLKDAMESRLSHGIIIPQDPVMSNALGLFKLVSREC
ncbi:MAG: ParM/StbA family protein [Nitrosotalea sp.]